MIEVLSWDVVYKIENNSSQRKALIRSDWRGMKVEDGQDRPKTVKFT